MLSAPFLLMPVIGLTQSKPWVEVCKTPPPAFSKVTNLDKT